MEYSIWCYARKEEAYVLTQEVAMGEEGGGTWEGSLISYSLSWSITFCLQHMGGENLLWGRAQMEGGDLNIAEHRLRVGGGGGLCCSLWRKHGGEVEEKHMGIYSCLWRVYSSWETLLWRKPGLLLYVYDQSRRNILRRRGHIRGRSRQV